MNSSKSCCPSILIHSTKDERHLSNILDRLSNMPFMNSANLVILVDQECGEIVRKSEEFRWGIGAKTVTGIRKDSSLESILHHLEFETSQNGSAILLGSDILLTDQFYDYVLESVTQYFDDDSIAGGALNHYHYNEFAGRIFRPLQDGSDVYFFQRASSIGQFLNYRQVKKFREWYEKHSKLDLGSMLLPESIIELPHDSWVKWFTAYLVDTGKYIVYPRVSFIAGFPSDLDDKFGNYESQSEYMHFSQKWVFKSFTDSRAKYDVFGELCSEVLKTLNLKLSSFEFEVDTMGMKPLDKIEKRYILTSKPGYCPVFGFEKSLRPEVSNIIRDLDGFDIQLCRTDSVEDNVRFNLRDEINYSFGVPCKLLGKAVIQYYQERGLLYTGWIFGCICLKRLFQAIWHLMKFSRKSEKGWNSKRMGGSRKQNMLIRSDFVVQLGFNRK